MIAKYVGIPFENRGCSFNGCDCYGLIVLIYKNELGIEIPSFQIDHTKTKTVLEEYKKQVIGNWVKVDEPELYDGIAMAEDPMHPSLVQHFGMYIGGGKIIHSTSKTGVIIDSIENIKASIKGIYRWKQ